MKVVVLLLAWCCFHQTSGALHSFTAHYIAVTGISNFPEFTADGVVDGELIQTYNSNTKKVEPRNEWVKNSKGPEDWKRELETIGGTEQTFKANIQTLMKRFNQSEGVHIVQQMYGCSLDDQSGVTDGFSQIGYDGEDLLNLDLKNLRWIGSKSQSLGTQNKWNSDRAFLEGDKNYYTTVCIDWLKKYVQYGSSTLERKVRPKVTLLQKDSKVMCHATGFYPEGVMITWKRDGEEMQEDVDVGETVPNEDGTFQKRAVLTVSPEEFKNRQYTCEVAHKSGETIILDETPIQRNNPESSFPLGAIIGGVVSIVLLAGVAGFFIRRKIKNADNKAGFSRAYTDDSSQSSSEKA